MLTVQHCGGQDQQAGSGAGRGSWGARCAGATARGAPAQLAARSVVSGVGLRRPSPAPPPANAPLLLRCAAGDARWRVQAVLEHGGASLSAMNWQPTQTEGS